VLPALVPVLVLLAVPALLVVEGVARESVR
jgi:hypothetical protein